MVLLHRATEDRPEVLIAAPGRPATSTPDSLRAREKAHARLTPVPEWLTPVPEWPGGRPIAQWPRLEVGRSDDLTGG
jgi:hypothetical protein